VFQKQTVYYVYMNTDNADVLYNNFYVYGNYQNTGSPTKYPNNNEYCAIARKDWKVIKCSEKQLAVCQGGLTIDISILMPLSLLDDLRYLQHVLDKSLSPL